MAGIADRTLVLLRHAKSAWPDVPDHERPLGRRGERDAPVVGRWLRTGGYLPDQVLCSTARRARDTWQLAQTTLRATAQVSFDRGLYQASAGQLLDLIRRVPSAAGTLLVVGHGPALPDLALALAAAAPPACADAASDAARRAGYDRMRVKFPTAAIAVFKCTGTWDRLIPGSARLAGFVTPRDLAGAPSRSENAP